MMISIRFVLKVHATLQHQPGKVFQIFPPDGKLFFLLEQ